LIVFFDTSVLVAAVIESHPFHARAICWVEAATQGRFEGRVAWHGIAETWAVLTRLPGSAVSAATAERLVNRLAEEIRPVAMSAKVYTAALRLCSDRGLRSGAIFDALHWAAADEANADLFLTFNPDDFVRLGSGAKPKVMVPPDPPSVRLPR